MEENVKALIAKHWNDATKIQRSKKFRHSWWESPTIIRHVNKTICGEYIDGWSAGAVRLLRHRQGDMKRKICGSETNRPE